MEPLYDLFKAGKAFVWTEACQRAFEKVKSAVCTEATLKFPRYDQPFIIFTDASGLHLGAVITQLDEKGFYRPLEFAGRSLLDCEQRYNTTDRELLGVIFGIRRFHHYIDGTHFTLYSDHTALVSLFNKKEHITNGRLARWVDTIMSYDFEVKFLAGSANVVADILSRRPYPPQDDDPIPLRCQGKVHMPPKVLRFSDISITKQFKSEDPIPASPIILGQPRSVLKGGRLWGEIGTKPKVVIAKKKSKERQLCNHTGKCLPTLCAVTRAQSQHTPPDIVVTQDTESGYNTRSRAARTGSLKVTATGRTNRSQLPKPTGVSRRAAVARRAKIAHRIAPLAEKALIQLSDHNPMNPSRSDLITEQKGDTFCITMYAYIQHSILPHDNSLAKQVLHNHDQFVVMDGVLFRTTHTVLGKTMDPTLQIVIPEKWTQAVIEATHSSPLGGHLGSVRTYNAVRTRYYWRNMFKDVHDFVGTCHTCLTTKKRPKHLKTPMTLRDPVLTTYSHLTMDTIGPFVKAHDGSRYIHVVVDHATRHITAWCSEKSDSAVIAWEFFNRVICIHGAPSVLNTDNASVYKSALFEGFCTKFGIKHVTGSAYWSVSQSLAERYNQAIESSLRAFVSKAQQYWSTFLQAVVFSLNNTVCTSLGYAPNLLVFGKQTHLPTEAALSLITDDDHKSTKDLALYLLQQKEKIQMMAAENMKETHRKMKLRHDATAVESKFRKGQLVYLHIPNLLSKGTSKKLQPTYSGPYMIVRETSPVTVILRRLQDRACGKQKHPCFTPQSSFKQSQRQSHFEKARNWTRGHPA